jgi:hypothetical protein
MLLIISLFMIMFMLHAITAMVLESAITRGSEEDSYARVE